MDQEIFLIWLYCAVDDAVRSIMGMGRLRARGAQPELTDAEALTIELFGEALALASDAAIWRHARVHLRDWFPALGGEWNFVRRCANLHGLKDAILGRLFQHGRWEAFDGLPLPVCRLVRAARDKCFKGEAAFSFCAAKNEHYYGFKAHALLNDRDEICAVMLTAANVDERQPLARLADGGCPLIFADKGADLGPTRRGSRRMWRRAGDPAAPEHGGPAAARAGTLGHAAASPHRNHVRPTRRAVRHKPHPWTRLLALVGTHPAQNPRLQLRRPLQQFHPSRLITSAAATT